MVLAFDGEPTIEQRQCPQCGRPHESAIGFVTRDGDAYAVYFVDWYPHESEAYVDVILGTWEEPDYPRQVTFGCRLGHVAEQEAPAASLVTGGAMRSDHPMFGSKLPRDAALGHPRLGEFWAVVDWLVLNDRTLHDHVYHMEDSTGRGETEL